MNWLTNFVRPKIRALVRKTDVPENLWEKCDACEQMIFRRDLEINHYVCQHCDFHMKLAPKARLASLFDDGDYQRVELPKAPLDPLKFRDSKRYTERLKTAQSKTGEDDAVIVAHGKMDGMGVVMAVFDFSFMGGSMGVAVGEAIIVAARLAVLQRSSLIMIPASGGARMQEGALSLMQLPRTTIAINEVKEAGLPYLVVLTNPTTGGVTASFAMLGDITLAEPNALIGFAGARVIETTIHEKLPEGFQRAEYLLEHGMIDMVVHRHALRQRLITLLGLLLRTGGPEAEIVELIPSELVIPEAGQAEANAPPPDVEG
ncbi:MAG: acetyl-CoA carboxylase carboxyltransferase subunit beta [Proteobacteria bacterium]|nr:acetyl-CoA carboxylase carboxyltransferase subunit beta [Pseudomonadota bacterium]